VLKVVDEVAAWCEQVRRAVFQQRHDNELVVQMQRSVG
jgi:hypothetical protein